MTLGGMHHLSLSVSDITRSAAFYDGVLGVLGYRRFPSPEDIVIWAKPGTGAVIISRSNPDSPNKAHDRYSPGLHHFAFGAESRDDVERLHARLQEIGANVLDPPAEYDYMPGYYAVFFADPDGLKLELCHTPLPPPETS